MDAEVFAREKEQMLRDPKRRAEIEAKVASCLHHANLISVEEWEPIQSEMKERGVQIDRYFLEPKPGTFAFDVFQRGGFNDLPPLYSLARVPDLLTHAY